jgi:hypothetical protein
MFIPEPGSSSFSHPGSRIQQQQKDEGEFVVVLYFVALNLTKLKLILFLKQVPTEKDSSQLTKN